MQGIELLCHEAILPTGKASQANPVGMDTIQTQEGNLYLSVVKSRAHRFKSKAPATTLRSTIDSAAGNIRLETPEFASAALVAGETPALPAITRISLRSQQSLESHGNELRDADLFHSHAIERAGHFHRPLVMSNHNELRIGGHLRDLVSKPSHVCFV